MEDSEVILFSEDSFRDIGKQIPAFNDVINENVSIQPGVYPTEMNSRVKSGVHADKPELRKPLDAIAEGTDIEFIEARAAIKSK